MAILHDKTWIIDVLLDLKNFASLNSLPRSEQAIDHALRTVSNELIPTDAEVVDIKYGPRKGKS